MCRLAALMFVSHCAHVFLCVAVSGCAGQLSMCAVFAHLQGVQELFNNPHLSDVTLLVEQRQIPAHRHVLATHSHMFDRMWNHSMKEVSHRSMLLFILSVCQCVSSFATLHHMQGQIMCCDVRIEC